MENERPLLIARELRVTTERSVWLIRPDRYLRLPREEAPRAAIDDLDGASTDGRWHAHDGAWVLTVGDEDHLRILPSGRFAGALGLISGPIQLVDGT